MKKRMIQQTAKTAILVSLLIICFLPLIACNCLFDHWCDDGKDCERQSKEVSLESVYVIDFESEQILETRNPKLQSSELIALYNQLKPMQLNADSIGCNDIEDRGGYYKGLYRIEIKEESGCWLLWPLIKWPEGYRDYLTIYSLSFPGSKQGKKLWSHRIQNWLTNIYPTVYRNFLMYLSPAGLTILNIENGETLFEFSMDYGFASFKDELIEKGPTLARSRFRYYYPVFSDGYVVLNGDNAILGSDSKWIENNRVYILKLAFQESETK